MKPPKPVFLVICIAFLLIHFGCKKDGTAISIEGFLFTDASGNDFGRYGPEDDDWMLKSTLSAHEMALFNFPVIATLDNTAEGTVGMEVKALPNPIAHVQSYYINTSDSILLRLVVVNNKLEVLQTGFLKSKGQSYIQLQYNDRSKFPNRAAFRVYFSFSALGKPNFKVGYGDIKICDGNASNVNDCFK